MNFTDRKLLITFKQNGTDIIGTVNNKTEITGTRKGDTITFKFFGAKFGLITGVWKVNPDGTKLEGTWSRSGDDGIWNLTKIGGFKTESDQASPENSLAAAQRQDYATPTKGDAAVIINLERFAALLRETKTNAWPGPDRIDEVVDTLRKHRSNGASSSVFLGINLSDILQSYAALLYDRGQGTKAREMEALAKWYTDCNLARFKGMQC